MNAGGFHRVSPPLSLLLALSFSSRLFLLLPRVQLKGETQRQGGKALRCKTRFANISGYVAKFSGVRRNRLP